MISNIMSRIAADLDALNFPTADLFSGAGGTSKGLMLAMEILGIHLDHIAVNHWDIAIDTHSLNHPYARHYRCDLQNIDPVILVPGRYLRLLLASPECTFFSDALGGKPMNDQSRASVKYVLRWLRNLYVEDVLIENVPGFLKWGPLDPKTMRPVKSKKGEYFHEFVRDLKKLGYCVEWRVLNAANYGDPTTRERLFIQARKTQPIRWPEQTHHKDGGDMFGELPRWRTAREIIDWSVKGTSIFNRGKKKPLAPNTLKRIQAGMRKYNGASFILQMDMHGRLQSLDEPINTITSTDARALVQPFIVPVNHGVGDLRTYSIDNPMPTITSVDALALVEPFLIEYYGMSETSSVDEPLPTVTGRDRFALIEPLVVQYEGKYYLVDILLRMLMPSELAAAMGFPKDYVFLGTREERVKQIGNSVPVNLAMQLILALLGSGTLSLSSKFQNWRM